MDNSGTLNTKRSNKLDGKINGLFEKQLISEIFRKYLHELRFLGNEALHDLELPSEVELKLSIEFIETLLFNIYSIEDHIENFEANKQIRKKRLTK